MKCDLSMGVCGYREMMYGKQNLIYKQKVREVRFMRIGDRIVISNSAQQCLVKGISWRLIQESDYALCINVCSTCQK